MKCVNHLSTDPHCLENLQRADAIRYLIPNLEFKEGPLVSQIHHEVNLSTCICAQFMNVMLEDACITCSCMHIVIYFVMHANIFFCVHINIYLLWIFNLYNWIVFLNGIIICRGRSAIKIFFSGFVDR